MNLASLCLVLAAMPQGEGKSGRLVLPPPPPAATAQAPTEPEQLAEIDRFHRDVMRLRRTARLSEASRDLVLKELSGRYENPSRLAMRLARTEDPDVLHGLLHVVRRYGDATDSKELLFLLLTRPFRNTTRLGVTVMSELAGDGAKIALMDCFTSRYAGVRKAATDLLLARIGPDDVEPLVDLSLEKDKSVRRKALYLLGALPYEASRNRLVDALVERDTAAASTACTSLIAHGPEVVPAMSAIVSQPARDRSFGYATFVLSTLEDQTGQLYLSDEMVPNLHAELTGFDPFMQTASAIALANMAFRSADQTGETYGDREIVDGLLLVVAPEEFVPNLSMLQRPATRKLEQFTAIEFRGRNNAWRTWWRKARPSFVGTRLALQISPENGSRAVVTWENQNRMVRFRGEDAVALPTAEDVAVDDYLLTGAEMAALVAHLQRQGFMTQGLLASAAGTDQLPVARTLALTLDGSRSHVSGPAAPARWLDALEAEVATVSERERWQLYRDPTTQPDPVEFWNQERLWLAANPSRVDRARRLIEQVLVAYPSLSESSQDRAISHLESLEGLSELLTEQHGATLAGLVQHEGAIDARTFRLLELALAVPGDITWRHVLDVVDGLQGDRSSQDVLPRLFGLLGAEKVRVAMADGRPRVRSAAIMEAANLRDMLAVPQLVAFLDEGDRPVREAAIYALGILRATDAREAIMELAGNPDEMGSTRRVAWVALGRIGGAGTLRLLQSGVASPELKDQLAAIQAMGELQDPEAAQFLAQVFVAHGHNPIGTQAMASLQKQGSLRARPALRRHLGIRDARVRNEIVLLLAEFGDPTVVPDLTTMIREEPNQMRPVLLLSGIVGLDLIAANDRVQVIREWWRRNRDRSQAEWFLDALARYSVATRLRLEQLGAGAGVGAVHELSRLMVDADKPFLRVMAASLLREVTKRDFGQVSMQTPPSQLQAVADRYRFFADAEEASRGR